MKIKCYPEKVIEFNGGFYAKMHKGSAKIRKERKVCNFVVGTSVDAKTKKLYLSIPI